MNDEDRKYLTEKMCAMSTGQIIEKGYHKFLIRGHHRADRNGYVRTSILIAEYVLGKRLPKKAIVHHCKPPQEDEFALVICEDQGFHKLLHTRLDALHECGNANLRKCPYCHSYDNPEGMVKTSRRSYYHQHCAKDYNNRYNKTLRRVNK